jgi:hypothetical protein
VECKLTQKVSAASEAPNRMSNVSLLRSSNSATEKAVLAVVAEERLLLLRTLTCLLPYRRHSRQSSKFTTPIAST